MAWNHNKVGTRPFLRTNLESDYYNLNMTVRNTICKYANFTSKLDVADSPIGLQPSDKGSFEYYRGRSGEWGQGVGGEPVL